MLNTDFMDIVDVIIIILALAAIFRGREIGSIRQLCSTVGFFGGLLVGAWVSPYGVQLGHTAVSRSIITLGITLGIALIGLGVAEYLGEILKSKVQVLHKIDVVDQGLGSLVSIVTLLITVWLSAAILIHLPYATIQDQLRGSTIVSWLDNSLPQAPNVIADLGHIIDPNGFPQVFTNGNEPAPTTVNLPPLSELASAVRKDQASVVKIEGQGCGGIVEGSGFVVANGLIATNAHVVAGVRNPEVIALNGNSYAATPIWFDPNLDFAVLKVRGFTAPALNVNTQIAPPNTPSAVIGYPGGGNFTADPASVMQEFTAVGRNIYNQGNTQRQVYEIKATVIPGNSGGPLINNSGQVIGIVFAQSTAYNQVGYALTTGQPMQELTQAEASMHPVSTGACAE